MAHSLPSSTKLAALAGKGLLDLKSARELGDVAARYAVAITPAMADLVVRGDTADPIALQFIPSAHERVVREGEQGDPIGDNAHSPAPGIVHRYADRALLKLTAICPVYCRFCFRREMIGPAHGAMLAADDLQQAFLYLRATPAIREVIVTGGDPLALSARRLSSVVAALAGIAHIKRVRWHSRVPVVAPDMIEGALIDALTCTTQAVVVAVHANHPREFTPAAKAALARLRTAGIGLLSQSVLLRGVNDDAVILSGLVDAFTAAGVQPYYVHQLDLASGTGHFRVPIAEGLALMEQLAKVLPGSTLPRYMLDLPGGFGKIDLAGGHVRHLAPGLYEVVDRYGNVHLYRDPASGADVARGLGGRQQEFTQVDSP